VVDDEQRLTRLSRYADETRQARSAFNTGAAFAAEWSKMLALETKGS
jgi:hypothetical protein